MVTKSTSNSVADKKRLIVLIDDDADEHYLLSKLIEIHHPDLKIVAIEDSSVTLSRLDLLDSLPSFILLDLYMPKKNGFEVLQELRAITRYNQLPIIVCSNSSNPDDEARCKELGASLFTQKPSSYKDLSIILNLPELE
jgi:CheY-like chemotaxis protein